MEKIKSTLRLFGASLLWWAVILVGTFASGIMVKLLVRFFLYGYNLW